jgi:signal transduction histidine kinase
VRADVAFAISQVSGVSAVPTMLRVITQITGLRLSLIAHVTDDTWTCCAVNDQMAFGLEVGGELDVATTLCSEVRLRQAPVVISHASLDPVFKDHRTPKLYNFESYISVPIFLRDGQYFGNVCALDTQPTDLTSSDKTVALFRLFAELIGLQLEAEAVQQRTTEALLDAHATAELREQFIAVLGHDLRTPLSSISMGADLLKSEALPPASMKVVARISRSVDRISRLVDDVVDFARGRLGGGIALQADPIADVTSLFRQVVEELRAAHPTRAIDLRVRGEGVIHGDAVRLSQLLQNLLGNALHYSPPGQHVSVDIELQERLLVLGVSNGGPAISPSIISRMFEPFKRGSQARPAGLGLGLYIASEIVRSHGGTIHVDSDDHVTTFTCRIPRSPA